MQNFIVAIWNLRPRDVNAQDVSKKLLKCMHYLFCLRILDIMINNNRIQSSVTVAVIVVFVGIWTVFD